MKHLIIYAHPGPESLNSHLKQTLIEHLWDSGHEVVVRDLYQLNFSPVLSLEDMQGQRMGIVANDVRQEQEFIAWADHITFIYPIWWTGMPAIMKGFIDRVFSYGFAYRYDQGVQKGLLTGKQITVINTHGKSKAEYEEIGMDKALSLTSDKGIFTYCGLEINNHFFFDKADRPLPESIENWSDQIISTYKCNHYEK
ncbi:NAD(P)H dehydrogenase (quinone) [Epilithonimonas hungarica]|jgi:Putative NADPH-quinone reductase (modulator of drug activity B)|uniref:NAD(P)H-dependent oxidoreductase n=1 Tax=Epilithonimonas hungarica TaxID=454006 RepID=UPI00278B01DA|nr:NAD(P)H-dependent oxidoreductase [Epilithonimonas hungarica]MDP9955177.1 NAD(P)H dehydrogenase (quinone) [Epilithonimonas hungarica]